MQRNNTRSQLFSFALLFALIFIFSSSCRRNKDCDLVVALQDGNTGAPIGGATVWVHPKTGTNGDLQMQDQTSSSDAAGNATFTFKLPAQLEITVTPGSPHTPPAPVLVKVEEGRSVTKTIKVY